MAAALELRLPPPDQRVTRRMLKSINAFLYDEMGFRGADNAEYQDVESSCFDQASSFPLPNGISVKRPSFTASLSRRPAPLV